MLLKIGRQVRHQVLIRVETDAAPPSGPGGTVFVMECPGDDDDIAAARERSVDNGLPLFVGQIEPRGFGLESGFVWRAEYDLDQSAPPTTDLDLSVASGRRWL